MLGDQLSLEAIGGEPWRGQAENWQPGPPFKQTPANKAHGHLLSAHRPVFCSGFLEGYPSSNVTDGREDTRWRAEPSDSGAWILVDLEGVKQVARVEITLGEAPRGGWAVECSEDRETFLCLAKNGTERRMTLPLPDARLRFLRVRFEKEPSEVAEVRVFS